MMEGLNKDGMVLARMRAPRLSCQQFDVLINFMRAHPHFAAGRAGGTLGLTTREEHELWWHQLTEELNAAIGPTKSTPKWQKCWIDLKSNARGRVSKIRAAMSNPALETVAPALTQWDHQVLSLMGPAYADILELCKTQQKKDYSTASDTAENNSNSSFHDQEHVYQHLENSPRASPYHSEENGHHSTSSDVALSGVKAEMEEDQEEIIFEEVECDVADAGYSEDLDAEHYNSIANGGKRKSADVQNEEDGYEKVPKGTLDVLERLAAAAEESNAIQREVVVALNRLSDSFAQIVPLVKHFSSSSIAPNRRS